MRKHESICVFSKKQSIYNPILSKKKLENIRPISGRTPSAQYGHFLSNSKEARKCPKDRSMPSSILFFNSESGNTPHPTQKPVALIEYLLKTYTIEGELVLDNTAGSGTLAIAAINTNRRYICIEKDPDYFEVMRNRIENHDPNAPIKTKKTKSVAKD